MFLGPSASLIYRFVTPFCGDTSRQECTRTIQEPKLSIRQEIAAVPEDMLKNALQNFEERLQMCVQQEGRHLNDIIFRT
jgi:hypothetical protein